MDLEGYTQMVNDAGGYRHNNEGFCKILHS